MGSYIGDGFTREGYIAAAPAEASGERLYDALTFSYRPATRMECIRLDAEVRVAKRNEDVDAACTIRGEKLVNDFLVTKLISWDLLNSGVHPVAISAAALERMNPFLFLHLYNIIRDVQASDPRPDAKTEEVKTDEEQLKN